MKTNRIVEERSPLSQPPSWDNSTLRSRLGDRPAPGVAIELLHALARDRVVTEPQRRRARGFRHR